MMAFSPYAVRFGQPSYAHDAQFGKRHPTDPSRVIYNAPKPGRKNHAYQAVLLVLLGLALLGGQTTTGEEAPLPATEMPSKIMDVNPLVEFIDPIVDGDTPAAPSAAPESYSSPTPVVQENAERGIGMLDLPDQTSFQTNAAPDFLSHYQPTVQDQSSNIENLTPTFEQLLEQMFERTNVPR